MVQSVKSPPQKHRRPEYGPRTHVKKQAQQGDR